MYTVPSGPMAAEAVTPPLVVLDHNRPPAEETAYTLLSVLPNTMVPLLEMTGTDCMEDEEGENIQFTTGTPLMPTTEDTPVCCLVRPNWPHTCENGDGDGVTLAVTLAVEDTEPERLMDGVTEPDKVRVGDTVAVPLTDAVTVTVTVSDAVRVVDTVAVLLLEALTLTVLDLVADVVSVVEAVTVGVAESDPVVEYVRVSVTVSVTVRLGDVDSVGEAVAELEMVGEALGLAMRYRMFPTEMTTAASAVMTGPYSSVACVMGGEPEAPTVTDQISAPVSDTACKTPLSVRNTIAPELVIAAVDASAPVAYVTAVEPVDGTMYRMPSLLPNTTLPSAATAGCVYTGPPVLYDHVAAPPRTGYACMSPLSSPKYTEVPVAATAYRG